MITRHRSFRALGSWLIFPLRDAIFRWLAHLDAGLFCLWEIRSGPYIYVVLESNVPHGILHFGVFRNMLAKHKVGTFMWVGCACGKMIFFGNRRKWLRE